MRRLALIVLLFVCLASTAMATTENVEMFEFDARMKITADVLGKPATSLLAVYSAPSEAAFRGADGKAAVSLREPFDGLALSNDENWMLIEYSVSGKAKRIGWIRIGNAEGPVPDPVYEWETLQELDETVRSGPEGPFDALMQISAADLMEVTREAELTDDPDGERRTLRKLKAGERIGGLGRFRAKDGSDFIYIRTEIDGKRAFGFVPEEAVHFSPSSHLEEDTLVIEEGIEFLGALLDTLDSGGFNYVDSGPVNGFIETGMIQGYFVNEIDLDEDRIRRVRLPGSLRVLGEDALYCLTLDELVIPEGVRYIRGFCPFMAMQIGTLVLPSTLEDFKFHMQFTNVGRYVLSEKNPWMVCVDDVIFSKDRKILLSYPNARPADGYTVPKGTEEIAEHAFYAGPYYDGYLLYPVPLRALSLPLGLKKIGVEAFVGLDELVSLTIPPTVETISANAFGEMASLQFLNMPDRLKNTFYAYWSKRRRTAKGFEGDNGDTGERMENE